MIDQVVSDLQQCVMQLKEGFEYTPEWYNQYYKRNWIDKTDLPGQLEASYAHDGDNTVRWFKGVELKGHGLEIGFSNGRSLYYLGKKYRDITMDGIDWASALKKTIPLIKGLCGCVNELTIANVNSVNQVDNYYDFVTALDVFEHTSEEDYFLCIKECFRVVRCGGFFYVYIGKPNNPSHINRRPYIQAIKEIESTGFRFIRRNPDNDCGLLIFLKNKGGV